MLDEYDSNVVALRICGDRTRVWGDNCPPRVALFTSEDVDAGFRFRWDKRNSGFDGFDSSSSQSGGVESQIGDEAWDASGDPDDVSGTDVAMSDANMDA